MSTALRLTIFLLFLSVQLFSQEPLLPQQIVQTKFSDVQPTAFTGASCPNPPPPGAESCSASCVYCDFEGYEGINNGSPSGGDPVCGQIAIHNDQWFGFVAGSDSIQIDVVSSNCETGDGLQIAIFASCDAPDAIVCNPGCAGCGNQVLSLEYTAFVPGQTYWLMVDGWVGDVCNFTLEVPHGSVLAPEPTPAPTPVGPSVVCPGATVVYSIPATFGAGYYHWTAPPGASINGGTNNLILDAPYGDTVTVTFGAVGGNICVQTGNSCYAPTTPACKPVTIQPLPATIKAPIYICAEELPYIWDESPYYELNQPGIYNLISSGYESSLGCDSIVRQTVVIKSPIITNLSQKTVCQGDCIVVGGESFCDPGAYSVYLTSYLGCDSLVNFVLNVLEPIAQIEGPTEILCDQTSITLSSAPSPGIKIWKNEAGMSVGAGNTLPVSLPGIYTLTTMLTTGGVTCAAMDTVHVEQNLAFLDVHITGADNGCESNPLTLFASNTNNPAQYSWTGPGGFSSTEQNPVVTEIGAYTVMVTTSNGCSGTATATVNAIGGTPQVTAEGDTLTCTELFGQLNGSASIAGSIFFWTGPNGFTSTEEDPIVFQQGQYSLTATSPGGCAATATANFVFIVNDLTAEANDVVIVCTTFPHLSCQTNAANPIFQWSGPNGFISNLPDPQVEEPGFYTVVVTDAVSGCTATDNAIATIDQEIPVFVVDLVHPTNGQNNGSLDLSVLSLGAFTYEWRQNGIVISTDQDLVNIGPGTYTVLVTNALGCSSTYTVELTGISGTSNIDENASWSIYPNPNSGKFWLSTNAGDGSAVQLEIYDSKGRLILEQQTARNQSLVEIDLHDVPAGVYFLEIQNGKQSAWKKIVVQR